MLHARAVVHVGITNPRWRGKHSWYSQRMRKTQFYVSGKRLIKQLTYGAEVLDGLLCWPVVQTVTLGQQHELVELTEDGVTRLMDGEHDGMAMTGQSAEIIE